MGSKVQQVEADAVAPPRPAMFPLPPQVASAAEAVATDAFILHGGLVDAWFIRRSDVLIVSFDNLASIGETVPPQPWLQARAAAAGLSILGIMAGRKDWYRNADTPALIEGLRDAGLFAQFRRVVFVGASMGGFAALVYAALVPGAAVLAFSPQSTLSRQIAPFEARYRYGARKWDWTDAAYLDAAATPAAGHEVTVVYDPFIPEDRAHADRLAGPAVRHLRVGHLGHRAIRHLKGLGLLQSLIEEVAQGTLDEGAFFAAFRARRDHPFWQRALLAQAEARGHPQLVRRLVAALPGSRFARRAGARVQPVIAPSEVEHIATIGTPQPPFRGAILELTGALVVPERDHDTKLASGVLRADGSHVELSRAWIRALKPTPIPTLSPDEPVVDLPGRHLFAGHFRGHFGHFLVESTARLWALDHIGQKPDGILYLPYRGSVGPIERAIEGHEAFFRLLGIDVPLRTFGSALRVERLFVPELGFGWSQRYAGSPAYRAFMQGRLSDAVTAEGGDKLYISRAKLNAQRGGILGETVIEDNLARAGYDIFHPERHPLEVQIARYKAARTILALDGSALHLAAYVLAPGAKVGIILRRSKANVADYALQYRSFCGVDPQVFDVIRHDWVSDDASRVDYRSVGEIDFSALFKALKAKGYVPARFAAKLPTKAAVMAMRADFGDRRGHTLRTLRAGEIISDD
ncbi:MAG: glycosyltransferase 61 family protein [Pseudomonadota bacterium]